MIGFLEACKEGETWSNCAVDCNKVCDYYHYILLKEGTCNDNSDCIPGKIFSRSYAG